jgi:hypothetical protein
MQTISFQAQDDATTEFAFKQAQRNIDKKIGLPRDTLSLLLKQYSIEM